MEKRILTVQDLSCVGQCSLTVALPIISACGIETSVLPSALLSTHTAGFTGFTVLDLTNEFFRITEHWKKEKITFDGVYTGYVLASQIDYIKTICNELNRGVKVVDPVMADNGSFYYGFDGEFAKKMATLCENADVILPNLTEAAFLLEKTPVLENYDESFIESTCKNLSEKLSVKCVVLTGVSFCDEKLGVAVYNRGEINYYFNERIKRNFHGTGDIFSSAFVGAYVNGKSEYESAKIAVDFTVKSIKNTLDYADKHGYGVFFEKALPSLINDLGLENE